METPSSTMIVQDEDFLHRHISMIVEKIKVEKIFLIALTQSNYRQSIFKSGLVSAGSNVYYDIVVIPALQEGRTVEEIRGILEDHPIFESCFTAHVYTMDHFNNWLVESDYFACTVLKKGFLCYDAAYLPLAYPGTMPMNEIKSRLQEDGYRYIKRADKFFGAAEAHGLSEAYELAVHQLNQAAEQSFLSIIRIGMGLKPETSQLDKLFRYSLSLVDGLEAIFLRNTQVEKQLFQLLENSCFDKKERATLVDKQVFIVLKNKVSELIKLAKNHASTIFM